MPARPLSAPPTPARRTTFPLMCACACFTSHSPEAELAGLAGDGARALRRIRRLRRRHGCPSGSRAEHACQGRSHHLTRLRSSALGGAGRVPRARRAGRGARPCPHERCRGWMRHSKRSWLRKLGRQPSAIRRRRSSPHASAPSSASLRLTRRRCSSRREVVQSITMQARRGAPLVRSRGCARP